ncbi:MAG: MraY family glycosyltransferase [Candidatus Cloacimonadales bacterium]
MIISYWKYLLAGGVVFLLTFLLIPVNIRFANKKGWLDYPNERSSHKTPIPISGGLAFGLIIILAQIAFAFFFWDKRSSIMVLGLSVINVLILTVGLVDDLLNLKAREKLLLQLLISILLYVVGFRIDILTNPFGSDLNLSYLSFPFTVFWFLAISNAINLIDGLDGLAAGITLISSVILCLVGLLAQNPLVFYLSIILVGGNLAFLKYNFYPAKIFMGDSGSLFNGFNLAVLSVTGVSQFKGVTAMTIALPVVVMLFPIMDTIMAMVRRIRKKKSIFVADKDHIHHKLLKLGISQKGICYIAYFLTSLFGLLAIGFYFSTKQIFLVALIIIISLCFVFGWLLLQSIFKDSK